MNEDIVKPNSYLTWEQGMGMLDFKFKFKDALAPLKEYGKILKKGFKDELILEHVFLLLKTSTYCTQWHIDITDLPSFAVLKQVVGKTVLLGSYGTLPAMFYSEDPRTEFMLE